MNSVMKAIGVLVMMFGAMLLGCETSTDPGSNHSLIVSSAKVDGVSFSLSIPASNFELTDTLTGVFKVINESGAVRQFDFANLQQQGFQLTDIYGRVAINSPEIFLPAISSIRLEPGKMIEYSIVSPFRNFEGELIERGQYKMSAFLLENNSPHVILNIEVR
jgi:hypothetical protein